MKKASEFSSDIKIGKDGKFVDAKRIFGLMGLGIKEGMEIKITAEGDDEEAAIAAMEEFLKESL